MQSTRWLCVAAAMLLSLPIPGFTQARTPVVQSPVLQFSEPAAVRIAGKTHVVYELHITNLRSVDIALTRVEVSDTNRPSGVLGDFKAAALDRLLGQPAAKANLAEPRILAAGSRAVLYVWLPVEAGHAVPTQLSHRIEFDVIRATGRESASVHAVPQIVTPQAPVVLGPPLRGDRWVALYDPDADRGHRRVLYTIDGHARIPGRFAIDWMKLGADGKFARGDESQISNWHGYGADVLAVADAVVADARDDIPEQPTLVDSPGPVALENASGNYVALDLGDGRYAFYEHLRHGSIRVERGERVRKGQVLGLVGNSGSSSSGPHLHFHVSNTESPLGAEGLPFVLSRFEMQGAFESMQSVGSGTPPGPVPQGLTPERLRELPAANSVVRF
jgi:murein DD-endopeptidase